MAKEVFKKIPGWNYQVSDRGRIRSFQKRHKNKFRRPLHTPNGYLNIHLWRNAKCWHIGIHRLVAMLFLGPPPTKYYHASHLDGNKTNNRVTNLQWATAKQNEAQKRIHGRMAIGEKNGWAKLKDIEAAEIKKSSLSTKILMARYHVSKYTINDIRAGNLWKHV